MEELEATDPKFDDVRILARTEDEELMIIPIKVGIMNIFLSYIPSDENYQVTDCLTRYTSMRLKLGACVRGLGTHLLKEVAFTFS